MAANPRNRVVIVGASAAGITCAEALRRLGHAGEVRVVGAEPDIPHDRPPLSKQVLDGSWAPEKAALISGERRDRLAATLQLGTTATALDVARRQVTLDDGGTLPFDEFVIATGVRPRLLPGQPPAGVHVLRTLDDALALRADILRRGRIAIVGAGFLGLEAAATARHLGASVTVVEPVEHPLRTRLGRSAAARLLDLHRSRGVEFRLGVGVEATDVDPAGRVRGLRLSDGSAVPATVVLVAIGCVPNVEWLESSELEVADGVVCDEFCQAAPGIWAAGDVARWKHVSLGRTLRIEHRLNASEQGLAVAQNITGPPAPFVPTPFFWTDHYETKVQVAGVITADAEERVLDGDEPNSFLHTYYVDDRLVGALGWNAPKALMPYRRQLRVGNALARR